MKTINAILAISSRDFTKFLRDRTRILATFIFPFLFIGILGASFQSNLSGVGFNYMDFVFTGVVGQVMFQSTAAGIISLIEDRKNDFAQELFVSPISRYTLVFGKIIGELTVSLAQGAGVIIFALIIGVNLNLAQFIRLAPAVVSSGLFGGAFGVAVMSNLSSERTANQIFPFVIFPQFFLAGVFNPIKNLPLILEILSKISPMRYTVDLVRGVYYAGNSSYPDLVLLSPLKNFLIMTFLFFIFLIPGTYLFVRNERNR